MTVTRKIVYPHPAATPHAYIAGGVPKGLHPTAGLSHNWAYDFMAPGGTEIFAVEAGRIWKLSGHDPATGVHDGDIFGWNIYLQTSDGLMYFFTHVGSRAVKVGYKVKKAQILGKVGHWPHDEGRSHTHLGVSHPMGDAASKRAIRNVAEAPHVRPAV